MHAKAVVSKAKAYLLARHQAVRSALKQMNLNGLLLTTPADLAYLTDFTGEDSIGLITADAFYFVTDFRYRQQSKSEVGWATISIREGDMAATLAKVLAKSGAAKIGFEANGATVGQIRAIEQAMESTGKTAAVRPELSPVENVMLSLRKIKDDHEVALIRKSVAVAEEAFEAVRSEIKIGQTESYLAALLDFEMRCRGASGSSFNTIVASGTSSALPHYRPLEKPIQKDHVLLIDWGAVVGGYCSDMTRTFIVGNVSPRLKAAYKAIVEAHKAAVSVLRPGMMTTSADRAARDVIDRAGFGEYFGHGLGHGIGRQIHELPGLRQTGGDDELRPGMVVTVEPGIYIPGEGGVRLEDDVLITHSGCELLTSFDRAFEANHIE